MVQELFSLLQFEGNKAILEFEECYGVQVTQITSTTFDVVLLANGHPFEGDTKENFKEITEEKVIDVINLMKQMDDELASSLSSDYGWLEDELDGDWDDDPLPGSGEHNTDKYAETINNSR